MNSGTTSGMPPSVPMGSLPHRHTDEPELLAPGVAAGTFSRLVYGPPPPGLEAVPFGVVALQQLLHD